VLKTAVQNLAFVGVLGVLLFLPAGTLAWPQAWIFLALFDGCAMILTII